MNRLVNQMAVSLVSMLIMGFIGCSTDAPLAPLSTYNDPALMVTTGDPVQLSSRVRTRDENQRMLTLEGKPDTVVAAHNCQIVRLLNDNETPIPFSDINPGDSVEVQGMRQQNGYVIAHRLKLCPEPGEGNYDLAFRETIVAIDYGLGTFTVAGRSETIMIDDATIIWGNLIIRHPGDNGMFQNQNNYAGCGLKPTAGYYGTQRDTVLTFTDLQVGDVVEVKANVVDENTLLAVKIKLAECTDYSRSIQFTASLASVDTDARIVTFDGQTWIGTICQGTKLLASDGTPQTLSDFAVGETIAIKGVPLVGDTLKICEMLEQ